MSLLSFLNFVCYTFPFGQPFNVLGHQIRNVTHCCQRSSIMCRLMEASSDLCTKYCVKLHLVSIRLLWHWKKVEHVNPCVMNNVAACVCNKHLFLDLSYSIIYFEDILQFHMLTVSLIPHVFKKEKEKTCQLLPPDKIILWF